MYWLRTIPVLLLAVLLQVTIVPALRVGPAQPDLLLLLAVGIVVREPVRREWGWNAFWLGWAAGLMADVYSVGSDIPFGTTAIVYGLVTLGLSRAGTELFVESAAAQVMVSLAACLAAQGALSAVLMVRTSGPAGVVVRQVLGSSVYSALAAPVVFAGVRSVERFLGVRSRRTFGSA